MTTETLHRNWFQRILGLCATPRPVDDGCWHLADGKVIVELPRAPELQEPGGAMRLEGKGLPVRLLVVCGPDHRFHAFRNRCSHVGRRLDPLPGEARLQCCSVGRSTFDFKGASLAGPGKRAIGVYPVLERDQQLVIDLSIDLDRKR